MLAAHRKLAAMMLLTLYSMQILSSASAIELGLLLEDTARDMRLCIFLELNLAKNTVRRLDRMPMFWFPSCMFNQVFDVFWADYTQVTWKRKHFNNIVIILKIGYIIRI